MGGEEFDMIKDRRTQKEEINLHYWGHFLHLAKAPLNQLQVSPLQPCKLSPTFEGKAMGLLYVKT